MRGKQTDVLGGAIQKSLHFSNPADKFLNDPLLTMPWLGTPQVVNRKANMANQRKSEFRMINQSQPVSLSLQNQAEQIFLPRGLARIPNAGLFRRE